MSHATRESKLKKVVRVFVSQELTIERAKSMRYEDLFLFMQGSAVNSATKECLQIVCNHCVARHGVYNYAVFSARCLLAGYMIAYHRGKVFGTMGDKERALFECAVPLLERFHAIVDAISKGRGFSSVPRSLSDGFEPMLREYMVRFGEWRIPEQHRYMHRLKDALLAVYDAEVVLKDSDEPLNNMFKQQVEELRAKLQEMAGAEALVAFDAERRSHIAGPRRRSKLPVRMTNEQLTHELMYNTDFQLKENMAYNWEGAISAGACEKYGDEFWVGVLEDLSVSDASRLLAVLNDIRHGIRTLHVQERVFDDVSAQGFLERSAEILDSIAEVIVRRQDAPRALDFGPSWATLRADLVAHSDKALRNAVQFLYDRVNKMRLDAVNANLRVISMEKNCVDLERRKFQEKLSDGTLTLERTEAWLAGVDTFDMLDSKRLYLKAMVSLVSSLSPITVDSCPETLLLDWPRLAQVQQDYIEWGPSFSEVFVNLVALSVAAQPLEVQATSAFKVAENLNLIASVNWGVHGDTYKNILGGVVRI